LRAQSVSPLQFRTHFVAVSGCFVVQEQDDPHLDGNRFQGAAQAQKPMR